MTRTEFYEGVVKFKNMLVEDNTNLAMSIHLVMNEMDINKLVCFLKKARRYSFKCTTVILAVLLAATYVEDLRRGWIFMMPATRDVMLYKDFSRAIVRDLNNPKCADQLYGILNLRYHYEDDKYYDDDYEDDEYYEEEE